MIAGLPCLNALHVSLEAMGSGQSKPENDDFVFTSGVPLQVSNGSTASCFTYTSTQFSQEVVNNLADASASPAPSHERQVSIDAQIRSRIEAELARLRGEEEEVRRQVEAELEKENIDSEAAAVAGRGEGEGGELGAEGEREGGESLHSSLLLGDVEEVRQRIDKFHGKSKGEEDAATVAGRTLASCYR